MKHVVTVRKATADDAWGIARVLVDGWKTTYADILPATFLASFNYDDHEAGTRQYLKDQPTSSAAFVALAEDGSVLGIAHVREAADGPKDFSGELEALYVMPSAQRRQVGTRLFLTTVRWLQEYSQRSMFLWVLRDNPYRRFYERLRGELLKEQREQDFGGSLFTQVAYGWRDLDALLRELDNLKP